MSAEYIKAYRCDGNYQQTNNSAPDGSIGCQSVETSLATFVLET
ncbi:hypothetical protein SAMN05216605_103436 [Pseudomonas abietaniphila]|uniref:Uncharacterized protein n=1 Tax=Pseudomonas abietaniphila TaxID=89065 RepID=A0A1G7XYC5_9PSED|nr:hypothetical protein SAMN05216605_103436 [Pseudomonas abietaniphila]